MKGEVRQDLQENNPTNRYLDQVPQKSKYLHNRPSKKSEGAELKTEDEKRKIKSEKDLISSNISSRRQPNSGGHCPKHCPKAKRAKTNKTTDPDDTLPDLPVTHLTEARDNTPDTTKLSKGSETSL